MTEIAAWQDGQWLRGDWHMHSRHSTDSSHNPIRGMIDYAERVGLDYLAITDHDNHVQGAIASHVWADPEFRSNRITLFYGAELTAPRGHINILSTRPYDHQRLFDARDARDWDLLALKRELGVHMSVNHPSAKNHYGYSFDLADSIEVWNTSRWEKNVPGLRIWDDMLLSGRMLPARGGSDAHHGLPDEPDMTRPQSLEAMANYLGTPTTWVYAKDRSSEAILSALEAGCAAVSANPLAPRAELWADLDGDGVFETGMGSNHPRPAATIQLELRLIGERMPGARYRVRLIRNRDELTTIWTDPKTGIASFTDQPNASGKTYYRAEVEGPQTPYAEVPYSMTQSAAMVALTNPVYLGYDPDF